MRAHRLDGLERVLTHASLLDVTNRLGRAMADPTRSRIAFTGQDLRLIPGALAHARRGRLIITANIGLALAVIIILFPLPLFGVLGLTGVVLAHEAAEVVAISTGFVQPAAQAPFDGSLRRLPRDQSRCLPHTCLVEVPHPQAEAAIAAS